MSLEIDLLVSFENKVTWLLSNSMLPKRYELLSLEFGAEVCNSHINYSYNDEVLHTEQRTPVKISTLTLSVSPAS